MLFRRFAFAFLFVNVIGTVSAAGTVLVDQIGLVFTKKSANLARGDRMIYANHDDVIHNIHIFEDDDDEADLGLQKPGVPLSYTFSRAGRYMVRCNIHPGMKMVVQVR